MRRNTPTVCSAIIVEPDKCDRKLEAEEFGHISLSDECVIVLCLSHKGL